MSPIEKSKKKKGFTLIETMVSVSIFVIVAFIVVSTLLTMSYAYKKAQKMRLIMDNFNFALQSMSLNIREGVNYSGDGCGNDGACIQFQPVDSFLTDGPASPTRVCYYLSKYSDPTLADGERGVIRKCADTCYNCLRDDGGSRLNSSSDIDINNLVFLINDNNSASLTRNRVKIMIDGTAGVAPREISNFFIETTVSQRNNDH